MAPRIPYSDYKFDPKVKANVLKMMGHSSATMESWLAIGSAHVTSLSICAYHRELVVLVTAAAHGAVYEWTHHQYLSKKQGVKPEQCSEIAKVAVPGSTQKWGVEDYQWKEKDLALLNFTLALQRGNTVDDAIFSEAKKHFTDRELMEITTVTGFYITLAKVVSTFGVELEPGVTPAKL